MQLVDTNVILRYVLQDHEDFYQQAKIVMESEEIFIPVEVAAEAVYVLEKVYHVDRTDIQDMLYTLDGYNNITFAENDVVMAALSIYCTHRIDFIDAVLCGYHQVKHVKIHSFDKQVNRILKRENNKEDR